MSGNDDLFHDIIMSEEISQNEGYEEGLSAGRRVGAAEGNRLGWEKGAGIGSEVGFYAGFCKLLLGTMKDDPKAKPRAVKSLEKILALVETYPLTEPLNPDLQTRLEEIRSLFKQVCSLLKINPGSASSDSNPGISF